MLSKNKWNTLSQEEHRVIILKGTEMPFSGNLEYESKEGSFVCRQCENELFTTEHKFESGCGWPSFDDELPNSIKYILDTDGRRTEIVCSNCEGHLGHVFEGERFTAKNKRHCVNSISIVFKKH